MNGMKVKFEESHYMNKCVDGGSADKCLTSVISQMRDFIRNGAPWIYLERKVLWTT